MLYANSCQGGGASKIVLRSANEYILDKIDCALHDALCVIKRMLEFNALMPGGGAVEATLSVYLNNYATSSGAETHQQLAVIKFADALLVV